MAGAVSVRGMPQLHALFKDFGKDASRDLNKTLREVAEPIRADAEALAVSEIPRVGLQWSRMRVGVTRKAVYVAPRQRGVRTRGPDPRRRPRFADLLAERAMDPALERNKANIEGRVEDAFERLADRWNRR